MTVVKIVHLIKHLWENFFLELIPGVYTTDSLLLDGMSGGFLVASGRAGRSRRRVHYFLERNWAGSNGFLQTLKRLATKVSSLVGRVSNSSDWAMTFRVKTQNFPPPPSQRYPARIFHQKGTPGAQISHQRWHFCMETCCWGAACSISSLRAMPHEECRNH